MSTLDTNVYKLPSFSKQAFKLQQEEKKERETEVSATRAEDTYMQNKHLLQGDFARDAGGAFGAFQEAGIKYKKTGAESDRLAMKEASAQLSLVIGAAKTQLDFAGKQYTEAVANQFDGYSMPKEDIQKSYAAFNNRSWETKFENGKMMVKEGSTFVPLNQSSIYSSTPNPSNTYMIPKAVQQGKYVLADSFAREFKSVSGASTEEKISKINSNIDYRFTNDPAFISDAAMHYEINDLGKFKNGYSADERRAAEKRYAEDPEYALAVQQSYKKDVAVKFEMYSGTSSKGFNSSPSVVSYGKKGEEKEIALFTLDKKVGNILGVGQDGEGNYYKVVDMGSGMTSTQPATDVDLAVVRGQAGEIPNIMESEAKPTEQPAEEQAPQEQAPEEQTNEEQTPQETTEEKQTQGFGGLQLDLPSMRNTPNPVTGRAAPVAAEAPADAETGAAMLPEWYYDNLIKFEGGVSTDKDDNAWALNPDAPTVNGKRAHTNRGVQWNVYKNFAERNGIPKSEWNNTFLEMSKSTAKAIVDDYAKASGASNFQDPVLRSFFTQNSWGTGKVWAADFKKGRSSEYRAVLDWLQGETGLNFANTGKINQEEAKAIEELYKKDPKKFIETFADKKEQHFKTLDDYKKFGDGWIRRLKELESEAIASL